MQSSSAPSTTAATHRVYFTISFDDKEEAKKLGAKWDPAKKLWYAPDGDVEISLLKFWRVHEEKPKPVTKPVFKPAPKPTGISKRTNAWHAPKYTKYPPIDPPKWAQDRMAKGEFVMSTAWDTRGD